MIAAIATGAAGGIVLAVTLVPIGYILYLAFARIAIEVIMVIFRIGADVRAMAERSAGTGGSPTD